MVMPVMRARAAMVVRGLIVVRRVRLIQVVVAGVLAAAEFALHARTADRAQHRRRHHTPNGEQHSKQQQEADTDGFQGQRSRIGWGPAIPGSSAAGSILNLVTVTRSRVRSAWFHHRGGAPLNPGVPQGCQQNGQGISTAAPFNVPWRKAARAASAWASGKRVVRTCSGRACAAARNSRPSRRVRLATDSSWRSSHSSR